MQINRTFFPGDTWLFIKIYCGNVFANEILCDVLYDILTQCYDLYGCKKWFFIRYSDPEPHLRLRFEIEEHSRLINDIVKQLEPYKRDGIIWNIEISTYKREIEKYLPENIETCEEIFSNESLMIIQLLRNQMDNKRFMTIALSLVSNLVDHLIDDSNERLDFLSKGFQAFKHEFLIDRTGVSQFNLKYKSISENLFNFDLNQYAQSKNYIIHFLKEQQRLIGLLRKKENIAHSIIHVFILRLVHSDNRFMECIIYHHLEKQYKTKKALGNHYIK